MKRWFVCVLALHSLCWGQEVDLSYPPPQGVYDPAVFLDADYRTAVTQRMKFVRDQRELEMFLILLKDPPAEEISELARKAGQAWAEGNYWVVIYQIGYEGEPGVVAGGELIEAMPPEMIEEQIRPALGKALLVTTRQSRLEELVNNVATNFVFLREAALRRIEEVGEAQRKAALAKQARRKQIMWALGLGLPLLAILGVAGFFKGRKILASKKPVEFPKTSPRLRLSGPHSGGGNVQVSFGSES